MGVDRDGNGKLEWNNGEVRNFIANLYARKGLPPPDDTTMYQMYRAFDANNDGGLNEAEAQRMAHATVLSLCSALGIPTEAAAQSPVTKVCPGGQHGQALYSVGEHVQVFINSHNAWMSATVVSVHRDGAADFKYNATNEMKQLSVFDQGSQVKR